MVISIVTETFWPDVNGVARTLRNLVSGLLDKGHRLQLVCPHSSDRSLDNSDQLSYLPVRGLPIPGYKEASFGFPSKSRLKKLWSNELPDIIYVATEGPLGWSAISTANELNIPVISGFHTNFHTYSKYYQIGFLEKSIKYYLSLLHKRTLTTLVPTEHQRTVLNSMGIENVSILGRGVNTSLFSPDKKDNALRASWGVQGDERVILYVGRIAAEKNLDLAIRTFYNLSQLDNRVKFVLVGDGPLAASLKKANPKFIFAGAKTGEELAKYYASADIFLFPSLTETFGNVVLEAMASGLGVVTFKYAAGEKHINHKKSGILATFNHSHEFRLGAKQLLEHASLLETIRKNAREYAETQQWPFIVNQFEELLKKHCNCQKDYLKFSESNEVKYES